ncbi:hypothetical protein F0562_021996 [Nyssa sinensis]|uniref:protein-serine/threonine phosphatase n=1 Tax=Nyssa sinensis TaxID=561372 RepID=A0A5J5BPW4_9ASTE|nr:hypothetical protein F0562_021996 [Nyssa sinensis]
MAEICWGVLKESKGSPGRETSPRASRRRRMEIRRFKLVAGVPTSNYTENEQKRQKLELHPASVSRECVNAVENCSSDREQSLSETNNENSAMEISISNQSPMLLSLVLRRSPSIALVAPEVQLKFGMASVCGRRRNMEDAVAIHPSFCRRGSETTSELHYFGVYDGHGCSHVAMKCRDRLHELVREELQSREASWKSAMERSFFRMDKEVIARKEGVVGASCRCDFQTSECDVVGSTAVVAIVTPDKIIVANCGDSRAVLCRNGKAIPLSSDHKPDRPDELERIEAAGGRVLCWDCPRVLGVLGMSRAIGDNYLKPYVSCEPEVTITDRTADDDCLILASDGLWDMVSNDTACDVANACLRGRARAATSTPCWTDSEAGGENADKACSEASMLLTKLALARRSMDNVSVVVIDLKER